MASVVMPSKSLWTLAPSHQHGMLGPSVYSQAASGMVFRTQPLGAEAAFLWEYYTFPWPTRAQPDSTKGESEIRKSPTPLRDSGWSTLRGLLPRGGAIWDRKPASLPPFLSLFLCPAPNLLSSYHMSRVRILLCPPGINWTAN